MKKLISLLIALLPLLPAGAVLQEKNLEQTLEVLHVELETTYKDLKQSIGRMTQMSEIQHRRMIETMQKSNQIALMLYSQKMDYTFNLAYACHEAAEQYHEYTDHILPYDDIMARLNTEIYRYAKLAQALQKLPPSLVKMDLPHDSLAPSALPDSLQPEKSKHKNAFLLSKQGQTNRNLCLHHAQAIMKEYVQLRDKLSQDSENYELTRQRLKEVFDYAQNRYKNIQKSIFINGGESYFEVLENPRRALWQAKRDLDNKYDNREFAKDNVKSEWRGPIVFGLVAFVTFYFLLSLALSNLIVRLLMKRVKRLQNENFKLKANCIIIAASLILFAVVMMVLRVFMQHNFILMASRLLVSFAWLIAVIVISLIIRLKGQQIKSGIRLYMPIILLGFIVIIFRIIFIPNTVVTLIFPPILLLFTLWQAMVIFKRRDKVPLSDNVYSWISLILMLVSCVMAWSGYVLMSVQVFIWWVIQLTLVQTITCIYDWLTKQEEKHLRKKTGGKNLQIIHSPIKRDGSNIQFTWFYDFVGMVVIPISAVCSVLAAIYYAAQVFDLTELCIRYFYMPFINVEGICHCSLFKLVLVVCLFFVFNYTSYAVKAGYRYLRRRHLARKNKGVGVAANQANFSLFNNVTFIIIWGIYFLTVLTFLHVPKSGISIVTAGLATGVGFAMKGLIENFFYGLQLMTGRLRSGDWIECDGIRGSVESITYQSTQILTDDGCVIAFLNSTLFNKNFKNLTRNHSYVMSKVLVGVSYGTDIGQAREILIEAVNSQRKKNKAGRDIVSPRRPVSVLVSNFGESSIDLLVVYWTLVENKVVFDCLVKEAIYDALNAHHIEIPFPQRDVNIRSAIRTPDISDEKLRSMGVDTRPEA